MPLSRKIGPLIVLALVFILLSCWPAGRTPLPSRPSAATKPPLPPQATVLPTRPAAPTAAPATTPTTVAPLARVAKPQIGLNFIRFFMPDKPGELDTTTPYYQPGYIFMEAIPGSPRSQGTASHWSQSPC